MVPAVESIATSTARANPILPRVAVTLNLEESLNVPDWPPCAGLPFTLQQSWLPKPERRFRSGTVWFAASSDALLCFAEFDDIDLYTRASQDHQFIGELGDGFELFVQSFADDEYFEFQISPNGCRLQLHYPCANALRDGGIEPYVRRDPLIETAVRCMPHENRWRIAVRLPVAALLKEKNCFRGEQWRIAACRHDSNEAAEVCLSSTATLTAPDFHRIGEWTIVVVPGGFPPIDPIRGA